MSKQDAEGVTQHINNTMRKYPLEAALHNLTHPCPPYMLEQAGENCKEFLRWKLAHTFGEEALYLLPK